jgi:hypothetical protein
MEISDLSKPGEKKKLIWAAILGVVAIILLWWTFFGFGKSSPSVSPTARPAITQTSTRGNQRPNTQADPSQQLNDLIATLSDVPTPTVNTNVPDARRNIFAFFVPPASTQKVSEAPPSTPTPTPPLLLASVSPSNVYARTAEFTLEASGDKFTPEVRIYVDGRELQTRYRGPQQLSATIPAAIISNPGTRTIAARSSDGRLYSNSLPLSVAPPPTPNYNYIGLISTRTHVDIALLQDLNTKAIVNAQRGDILGGRFRLTSIADRELVFVDTTLKIKHMLAMTEGDKALGSPLSRPTPRVDAEDDEPH